MKTRVFLKYARVSLAILATAGCLFLCMPFFGLESARGQAKLIVDVHPGNCSACHGDAGVLSNNHPDTAKMDLKTCRTCHKDVQRKGQKSTSLSGRLSLSHMHALAGNDCKTCHQEGLKPPATGSCLTCHKDYGAKENKFNKSLPKVHDTHMGDLSCDLCHKVHGKSVNFCVQCHPDWKYIVP